MNFSYTVTYFLFNVFQFQDVLTESDKAMSVVKDLFGDDPKVMYMLQLINFFISGNFFSFFLDMVNYAINEVETKEK